MSTQERNDQKDQKNSPDPSIGERDRNVTENQRNQDPIKRGEEWPEEE